MSEVQQATTSRPELYELYRIPRQLGPLASRFLDEVALPPGFRVLDVACGTGVVARLAAARVTTTGKVAALDLDEEMLEVARNQSAGIEVPIEWTRGDASTLPYGDASFDAVLCQQGLQWFADKLAALREMRRVATPGGLVALNVWGEPCRYVRSLIDALGSSIGEEAAALALAPFALHDPALLRALAAAAGFTQIEIRTRVLCRRVEPTQDWLLQDAADMPFGGALAAMRPVARAALLRRIAASLRDLWHVDSFAVPADVHFLFARA